MTSNEVTEVEEVATDEVSTGKTAPDAAQAEHAAAPQADIVHPSGVFRLRGWFGRALLIPLVGLVVFTGRYWPQGTVGDTVCDCVGLALLVAAVGMRTWATLYLGGRKSKQLVMTGPYSLCRNPLYLGSFLVGVAMAVLLQSLTLAAVFLVVAPLMYRPVIREEERILELNFGQAFRDYKARVPRRVFPMSLRHLVAERWQEVDMRAMRLHLGRVLRAMLLYPAAEVIAHLQSNGMIPVWFHLP